MSNHNKKRNVALSYQFLVKHVAKKLVEGDQASAGLALGIIKKHFKPGTELYKELRLINALANTTVSSEAVASSIMQEAKRAARSHDSRKLESEKHHLIRAIGRLNDDSFYDQPIAEYRDLATLQNLLNMWRGTTDVSKLALHEDSAFKLLTTSRPEREVKRVNEENVGTNRFILKIMLKKLNQKYAGTLLPEQRDLLRSYALSSTKNDDTIVQRVSQLKEEVIASIEKYINNNPDDFVINNLREVKDRLSNEVVEPTDSCVANFMLYAKLKSELESEDR